jgi:hypothetical protein
MDAYFDSAIIVKLYVREATSPDAIRLVGAYVTPYGLTPWQALEVSTAFASTISGGFVSGGNRARTKWKLWTIIENL